MSEEIDRASRKERVKKMEQVRKYTADGTGTQDKLATSERVEVTRDKGKQGQQM